MSSLRDLPQYRKFLLQLLEKKLITKEIVLKELEGNNLSQHTLKGLLGDLKKIKPLLDGEAGYLGIYEEDCQKVCKYLINNKGEYNETAHD